MKNKNNTQWSALRRVSGIAVLAAAALGLSTQVRANSITINLSDIGTYSGYSDANTSDTFTGTGFLGIYPVGGSVTPSFAHLFGLEYYNNIYSETEIQASLAGLSGVTINSASLQFSLTSGSGGNESVNVTSFTTTGTLGFNSSAPNNLGSVTANGITQGANAINVTSLVSGAVAADQSWLGLFLSPEGPGNNFLWTFTYSGDGGNANSANAELVINYTPNAVPDASSSLVLLGISLLFLYAGGRFSGKLQRPVTARF